MGWRGKEEREWRSKKEETIRGRKRKYVASCNATDHHALRLELPTYVHIPSGSSPLSPNLLYVQHWLCRRILGTAPYIGTIYLCSHYDIHITMLCVQPFHVKNIDNTRHSIMYHSTPYITSSDHVDNWNVVAAHLDYFSDIHDHYQNPLPHHNILTTSIFIDH